MYLYFPFLLNVWRFTFPKPYPSWRYLISSRCGMWSVEWNKITGRLIYRRSGVQIWAVWPCPSPRPSPRAGEEEATLTRSEAAAEAAGGHQLWCSRKCTTTNSSTSRRRRRRWRRWRRRAAASRTSTREPRPGLPGTSGGSITSLMPSPSPQAGAYFKCHTVRAQLKVILVRDPDGANLSTYTKYYHISWTRCILNSKYQITQQTLKLFQTYDRQKFQQQKSFVFGYRLIRYFPYPSPP